MTEILQKCDTGKEVSLGIGWNSFWSVFLFPPPLSVSEPEYELFAKILDGNGRRESEEERPACSDKEL